MSQRFYVETLGCPKNQVDSDKLEGTLTADGLQRVTSAEEADVVVVNTCAFIDEARAESIDTILALAAQRRPGAELVVTGCLAERHGDELAAELPEIDRIAPFGAALVSTPRIRPVPVSLGPTRRTPDFDLLNLPRPASGRPWAYVKIAEGCDRACGFCAIPSFRGPQRSRSIEQILAEMQPIDRFGTMILVFAGVAPLLGLLGTVTGMIATFDAITEFGTGDPRLLSGGISEALITTELGLIVAIPTLLVGNLLSGMGEKLKRRLEVGALAVSNLAEPLVDDDEDEAAEPVSGSPDLHVVTAL